MKNFRSKTVITLIATFLMMTVAAPYMVTLTTAANTTLTYPIIEALPNPVGVNQSTLINYGLLNYLNTANDGWNCTVIVTDPDGNEEILHTTKTWSTGSAGMYYTPNKVGTYYLQTKFEQVTYRNVIYLASETAKLPLIVQEAAVPLYPAQALPGEYWTRPIDSQLRSWYTLAGSWLTDPNDLISEYNSGPESAHILWTRPLGGEQGGLVGGSFADSGDHGFGNGDAYEGKWGTRLIVAGILYYIEYQVQSKQSVVAINLRTGEEIWRNKLNGQTPSFGQILYWDCRNYRGAFSYLVVQSGGGFFSTTSPTAWQFFEPLTGEWVFNMTNIPSGTIYVDDIGSLVKYAVSGGRLTQWNASYAVIAGRTGMSESWGSSVKGLSINAATRANGGYDINVSAPAGISGSIINVWPGEKIVGGSISQTAGVRLWGLSLEKGYEGTLLFDQTSAAPSEWVAGNVSVSGMQGGWVATSREAGAIWGSFPRKHWVYSFETGKFLFETPSQHFADEWDDSPGSSHNIYDGKLYSSSVSGVVYCYDLAGNGQPLWTYNASDPYGESYISTNWWSMALFYTDGKCYIGSMEHSAQDPKPRGAPMYCLNATDGTLIWRADGLFRSSRWGGRAIIGDSVIAAMDTYDQRVYAIGKGPSTMTVTAPDTAAEFGDAVIIRGTVMDNSPGTQSDEIKLRFPNGVPAVSDASMSKWMLHVYKQFSQPGDAVGVSVSIDAIDPNNNYVHLGDATTDASGMFSLMYTPEIPGYFAVYATFGGSAGYYASYAETTFGVMEAPPVTPAPTASPTPMSEAYFVPAIIGIIVAIIVVGLVLGFLLIRKRA